MLSTHRVDAVLLDSFRNGATERQPELPLPQRPLGGGGKVRRFQPLLIAVPKTISCTNCRR
jgi:hypothetical protein